MAISCTKAVLVAGLIGLTAQAGVARAQSAEPKSPWAIMEAMKSAPVSPNGRAMEAIWERAPEAPDGNIEDARPCFVSSWGGIVIRGKRNGDFIDRALAARHCGASNNPATDITFIGEAPPNICEGVTAVAENETRSFSSPVTLKGRDTHYVNLARPMAGLCANLCRVSMASRSPASPATGEAASDWGISSLGAFYRNEDGKRVFYAPGETVKLYDDFSFVVEPVMDDDELQAKAEAGVMKSIDTDPALAKIGESDRQSVPVAGLLLLFGLPLAIIAGIVFAVRHFRRRRGKVPAAPVAAIAPADIPVGHEPCRCRQGQRRRAACRSRPDIRQPIDRLREWRALEPGQRYRIIGGAAVLLLFLLFVILRPSTDPTTILRKLASEAKAGTAQSELGERLNEETLAGELQSGGDFVSPAAGHKARFAAYRSGEAKIIFDVFSSSADAEAALAKIRAGGPEEELLLPAVARGAATGFGDRSVVPFKPQIVFECRNTANYLYCMTQPAKTALLLTVRVPADTVIPIPGVADAKTHAETEARDAIDRLKNVAIGNR
ncbi:MAG: hypothetical protein IPK89_03930 [Sphingomonadales bacterium]|nr:hypothetical protein [Sphingomonadales bacterium]